MRTSTGKVHVAAKGRLVLHHELGCSGRWVAGCVPTDEPVNCRSCLQRFAGSAELLGISVEPVEESGTAPDSDPAGRPNRVLATAQRYREGFKVNPATAAELKGALVFELSPEAAWAIREWTERAREAGAITDEEAATVTGAIERGAWRPTADLALRCAIVQLQAELLGAAA